MPSPIVIPEVVKLRAIAFGLSAAVVTLAVYGFLGGNTLLLMMLAVAPLVVLAVNRVNWAFIFMIGAFHSWIYVPGFPGELSMFYIVAGALTPILLLKRAIEPISYPSSSVMRSLIIGYLLVTLITMSVRGFGIKFFGSSLWGGKHYVHLCVVCALYIVADSVLLKPKEWRLAVILFFAAVFFPVIAEQVYVRTSGMEFLYHFIRPDALSASSALTAYESGSGILRFSVSKLISYLFILSLALFPFSGRYRFLIGFFLSIAVIFAGLSGHRSTALYLVLVIPTFILFRLRRKSFPLIFMYIVALVCGVLLLSVLGTMLPLSFQRAVSWVPFADISSEAREAAAVTTRWRINLWSMLLPYLKEYWLLGRGFAFDPSELSFLDFFHSSEYSLRLTTRAYHNGPLSMFIDLGLFGLLFGAGFMIYGCILHIFRLRDLWPDPRMARLHIAILASVCVDVFRFFVVYGHASDSMVALMIQFIILNGLYCTNRALLAGDPTMLEASPSDSDPGEE